MQNNQELPIEVWIIQESLSPQQIANITINSSLPLSTFKTIICTQLGLDPDRYELLSLQNIDGSCILQSLLSTELKIEQTQIVNTLKICLKFEDINWDFSKCQDSNFSSQITNGNFNLLSERIKEIMKKPKTRIRIKKISVIQKNLKLLLAELKMGY